MAETWFLNYTHGSSLKNLCEEILKISNLTSNMSVWKQRIINEKKLICKAHTELWDHPVSDYCYFDFLQQLEQILESSTDIRENIAIIQSEVAQLTRQKIHILLLTQEPSCWPSIESVFYAAMKSADYEATLVYTPFFHQHFIEQTDYFPFYAEDIKVPAIRHGDYNLEQDSPDVAFIIKPYGNIPEAYQVKHLQHVIPRIVYIPYGMEITTDLAKFGFQYYLHYKAWRHCAYGPVVKEYAKEYGYRNGENIAIWGHPKADHYKDCIKNRARIPEAWKEFIKGRKTILWTPHHLVDLASSGTGTWLLWGEKILNFAFHEPGIVFIIRPHPLMVGALLDSGVMSQRQVDQMLEKIRHSDNIIWDTSPTYYDAVDAADAIITDGTTFSIEFLYTKKPILLTPRNMSGFYFFEEMLESYYIAREFSDILNFVENIKHGKDPLQEKRIALYHKAFFIPKEGTVGEYILQQVKKDLDTESMREIPDQKDSQSGQIYENSLRERIDKRNDFPLVSIVVLAYKNAKLLYGMLDSIFKQNYPNIQLLISDDCSQDFDIKQIENYVIAHKRHNIQKFSVLKNEENMGTVRHVHKVLQLVEGDYVILTAADDRFYGNDVISCYIEKFLSLPEAKWLVAKCNMTTPDYTKTVYVAPTPADATYLEERDSQKIFSRWSRRGIAIPCCMAFCRDAFDLVGGIDLEYRYLEDWPLVLKLLRKGYAPIYLDKVAAIHSMGGITNSNARYGAELRKAFYEDKYLIFQKEVEPYKNLMYPEDLKAYKQYRWEILERLYFFNIEYSCCRRGGKVKLLIKKPYAIWWVFEQQFMKKREKLKRKKMMFFSQLLLLFSMLFFYVQSNFLLEIIFHSMATVDMLLAILLFAVSVVTYPLEKYFLYKDRLRKTLVN